MNRIKHSAFTLAEVLITLGIIGMVAQMTIPPLYNDTITKIWKTKYKKAYAIANSAVNASYTNNEFVMRKIAETPLVDEEANFTAFKSHFLIKKECNASNLSECWTNASDPALFTFNFYPLNYTYSAFIDNSGVAWTYCPGYTTGKPTIIYVDVNGAVEPNRFGIDRFPFPLLPTNEQSINNINHISIGDYVPARIGILQDFSEFDLYNCVNGATHPCNYRSWLEIF